MGNPTKLLGAEPDDEIYYRWQHTRLLVRVLQRLDGHLFLAEADHVPSSGYYQVQPTRRRVAPDVLQGWDMYGRITAAGQFQGVSEAPARPEPMTKAEPQAEQLCLFG